MRACEAIQLAIGEGLLAWERRSWHQLDRFTFVRDDGEGGVIAMTGDVIASGSDAIQLVIGGGVAGMGEKWLALAGSLHVRSR